MSDEKKTEDKKEPVPSTKAQEAFAKFKADTDPTEMSGEELNEHNSMLYKMERDAGKEGEDNKAAQDKFVKDGHYMGFTADWLSENMADLESEHPDLTPERRKQISEYSIANNRIPTEAHTRILLDEERAKTAKSAKEAGDKDKARNRHRGVHSAPEDDNPTIVHLQPGRMQRKEKTNNIMKSERFKEIWAAKEAAGG